MITIKKTMIMMIIYDCHGNSMLDEISSNDSNSSSSIHSTERKIIEPDCIVIAVTLSCHMLKLTMQPDLENIYLLIFVDI